jgi:hypothetical protein
MRSPRLPLLFLIVGMPVLLIFGFSSPAGGDDKTGENKEELVQAFARLEPGMTPEQVRAKLPSPKRVARQLLYHRYLEQWIYDQPFTARLTFDCHRGQKPRLLEKPLVPAEKR